ncbi:MAG TPA: DEAD/DEAH box helicase, partial [Actinomycetota bacterium]|nr:DEAD/DEAH box helicase [Actinomycetota bacterium]
MASLAPLLDLLPDERVQALLASRGAITVPDPARPFVLASLVRHLDAPILAIAARGEEAEGLARDVHAFLGRDGAEVFPGWEVLPGEAIAPSTDTMGRRLHALARLRAGHRFVLVTTAQGATQLVAPPGEVELVEIRPGSMVDLDEISGRLVDMGYERNYIVERRGEFAIRGGILDVFPPSSERPVRAELWGDEVTSLRQFALASQRSRDEVESVSISPCVERAPKDDGVPVTSFLPTGAPAVVLEPKRVRDRAAEVLDLVTEWAELSGVTEQHYVPLDDALAGLPVALMTTFSEPGAESLAADTWTAAAGRPQVLVDALKSHVARGFRAVVAASLEETAERLAGNLSSSGLPAKVVGEAPAPDAPPGAYVVVAELARGFVLPSARLALVAESDITGRRSSAARRRIQSRRRGPSGPLDLAEGDLVVHEVHGIGRYAGMVERELLGVHREYLVIEYLKDDKLYVPSDQVDLVSKYVGGEAPKISRLGSAEWSKAKSRVRRRAREIAQELVKLYAERLRAKGHAYGPDTPWQRELEEAFPYEETPDQLRAVDEVKDDMERPVPMDRLVCGDVGYGKTEIAVRAAFKAVAAGKQVAVLVPTTILAQQHHSTFVERFRSFPVRVEMLSRFLSSAESKKVVADLAEGKVDVVVGTHRLLQPDVKFHDLGLVIVDEEQRFGVDQKEKLKTLRTSVDVLTLTATPIPRTLEMAMSGIRDVSIVDTPPEDRHPVMTYVGEYDEQMVGSAIRRELLRDGQVFYVHHRVDTIGHAARRVQELVPDARVGVAHGQMDERSL